MRSRLAEAWFVARTDLAHLLRQRETLVWVFVMPPIFFYFIGTVTGGFGVDAGSDAPDPLVLEVEGQGGFLVDELVARLEAQDFAVGRRSAGDTASRGEGDASSSPVLRVPGPPPGHADLTEAVLAGREVEVTLDAVGDDPAALFQRIRVARAVYGVVADLAVVELEDLPRERDAFRRVREAPRSLTLSVTTAGVRREPPHGFEQAVPGMVVMFTMLVLLTSGTVTLVLERERGLLRRLASTPIGRGSVVAGKWSSRMALGLVQIAFGAVAGTLLFGVDWGGSLGAVAGVLFAWASLNASLAVLVANVCRTQAQAAAGGVVAAMVLAALGGAWWPIEVAPGWMQTLALFLPTGWAMDALHRLVSFGMGASSVLPHAGGLVVLALVTGWAAARTFRYDTAT